MNSTAVQVQEHNNTERVLLTSRQIDKEYTQADVLKRDRELHEQIMSGNREAYGELWGHYRGLVLKNCKLMIKNVDDAEDATDEIGLKVLKNIDSFNPKYSIVPWLKKITKNYCINFITRRVKYPTVFASEADTKEGKLSNDMIRYQNAPDTMFRTPFENAEASEIAENIMQAMNKLSESHRQIITLIDFEDSSYDGAATELDIPIGTVMSRLFNARKEFRKHYRAIINVPTGTIFK